MKFLDQAKIYIKAGDGGSGQLVFVEKNSSNLVDLTGVMVEMVVLLYFNQIEILTL